jgi:hypothetical protein
VDGWLSGTSERWRSKGGGQRHPRAPQKKALYATRALVILATSRPSPWGGESDFENDNILVTVLLLQTTMCFEVPAAAPQARLWGRTTPRRALACFA